MTLHQRLGAAIVVLGTVGAVGAAVGIVRGTPGATLRVFVLLSAAVVGVEALIGLILLASGHRPLERIHVMYGALLVLCVPVARRLGSEGSERVEATALLGACLALALLGVRAVATGGG